MSNEEIKAKIDAVIDASVVTCLGVQNVNQQPHPFMIGARHVTYASKHHNGMLGEDACRAIPCAHPHCGLPYDQYTKGDKVAFIRLTRNCTDTEFTKVMQTVIAAIGDNAVDGFTFVETREKYRITKTKEDEKEQNCKG